MNKERQRSCGTFHICVAFSLFTAGCTRRASGRCFTKRLQSVSVKKPSPLQARFPERLHRQPQFSEMRRIGAFFHKLLTESRLSTYRPIRPRFHVPDIQVMAVPFAAYGLAVCRLWPCRLQVMGVPFAAYGGKCSGRRGLRDAQPPVPEAFFCPSACCNSFFRSGGNVNVLTYLNISRNRGAAVRQARAYSMLSVLV